MSNPVKLTDHLRALLLTGAVALTTQPAESQAAASASDKDSLARRIEALRKQVTSPTGDVAFRTGDGPDQSGADVRWWRNFWGNHGWNPWRNWHNGWHNWGNHWGNWHNW